MFFTVPIFSCEMQLYDSVKMVIPNYLHEPTQIYILMRDDILMSIEELKLGVVYNQCILLYVHMDTYIVTLLIETAIWVL